MKKRRYVSSSVIVRDNAKRQTLVYEEHPVLNKRVVLVRDQIIQADDGLGTSTKRTPGIS